MSRLRSSIVLLALATAFGVAVPCASAVDPFPNTGIVTMQSAHFQIHYNRQDISQQCPTMAITQEQAGDILGYAERAYDFYTSWGYPAPPLDSDGNGYYDISVDQFDVPANTCVSYNPIAPPPTVPAEEDGSHKRWDALINPDNPNTGFIHLDSRKGLNFHIVAHEVFHLFGLGLDSGAEQWLQEGSAEWATFRAESFLTPTDQDLGVNPDRTADCVGSDCGDTDLDRNGYPGWLLFEYLAERYGQDAVHQVWLKPGTGVDKLAAYLAPTTVESFYNDFAKTRLTGGLTLPAVKDKLPAAFATITAPDTTGALATTYANVNHLAARFVTIHHTNPANVRAPCYAATLALTITIPEGATPSTPIPSTPYYYANTYGAAARPFVLSVDPVTGRTLAKLTINDWNTCASSPDAWIALPNDSWNPGLDGREFRIDGTVNVDVNTPASPASPSGTVSVPGPVIATPGSDPAPTLKLYAPEILRVSSTNRVLRFVIYSSGSGKLHAALGSSDLGTSALRAGNNDVRFTLPKTLVAALRRTSARSVLALTSLSPQGASGATITRGVVIQAPPKKKKKTVKHR